MDSENEGRLMLRVASHQSDLAASLRVREPNDP